jgi:hypothetical protein
VIITLSCAGTPPVDEPVGSGSGDETPPAAVAEGDAATAIAPDEAPQADKAPQAFAKLDAGLNAILASEDPMQTAADSGYRIKDERIQVTIVTGDDQLADVQQWIEDNDAQQVSAAGNEVQAHVSLDLLRKLGRHPGIEYVRQPTYITDPGLNE